MFRRSALSMLLVAGLAVTGAACGGGGKSSADSSTSTPSASGAGDAQAVLASIRTNVGDLGPQKISVKFSATISGSPKDPTLGAFLTKPITLTLDGPVDSKGKKADLTFEVAAGPIKVDGGFRQVGDDSFVEVNGKWYSIPAGALSSATGSSGGSTTTTTPERRPAGDPRCVRRPEEALHEREARRHGGRRRHQVGSRPGRRRPRGPRPGHRGGRQVVGQQRRLRVPCRRPRSHRPSARCSST